MRANYWILGLLVMMAIVSIYMSSDPQQSERLRQMYNDMALTGETREYVLLLLAAGIGGFIVYLAMTRR